MSKPEKVVCDKLIGSKIQIGDITLEDKDAMLYALGIGFNMGNLYSIQIHSEKKISNILTNGAQILQHFPLLLQL